MDIRDLLRLFDVIIKTKLLFLGQVVDGEISNQLIGLMLYLSAESDTKDLYLFINSPGGWVIPGIAIYDTMQFLRPDVQTICMGLFSSSLQRNRLFSSSLKCLSVQGLLRLMRPRSRNRLFSSNLQRKVTAFLLDPLGMTRLRNNCE
ncbi:hypothetical protein ACOSP7_006137 [Xanthoceras sorbifolium]